MLVDVLVGGLEVVVVVDTGGGGTTVVVGLDGAVPREGVAEHVLT